MSKHKIGDLVGYTSLSGGQLHLGVIKKIEDKLYYVDWINPVRVHTIDCYKQREIKIMKTVIDEWKKVWEQDEQSQCG